MQGIGNAGGFKTMLADRAGLGSEALVNAANTLVASANKDPSFAGVFTLFNTGPEDVMLAVEVSDTMLRREMQPIFQDPFGSLNPRMTVSRILATPLLIHEPSASRHQRRERVDEALSFVGLPTDAADRFPHEFSGGQRQRIVIARALIMQPRFVVADEPVSALDVSVQAQIVNLLEQLRATFGLAMLFVSHDLAVVGHVSDRIAVMYLGRIVELGPAATVLASPAHPYTEALLSAVPVIRSGAPRRVLSSGEMPSPINPPSGCTFRTRCPYAIVACGEQHPPLDQREAGHYSACLRHDLSLRGA